MEQQFTDYGILYVDDEEKSLKYFEAIFEDIAPIYTATGPEQGMEIFQANHHRIGLVLSDKKMPNESGIDFLKRVRDYDPEPLRFLVTAFADFGVAVDALNDGLLYSYLSKPWDPEEMEHRLIRALKHFCLRKEREQLIAEKAAAVNQLMMADKAASIGILSSGLNHHLRNALTVMRTFHEMLPMQLEEELGISPDSSTFWNEYYNEVGGQIERVTSMLKNLSEGTAASRMDLEHDIDIEEVMRAASEIAIESDVAISVSIEADANAPKVSGDLQKISQMARLLFQEAKSSLHDGGEIEVKITEAENDSKSVAIEFIDNGPLIPSAHHDRLFDPFFVRSDKPQELGTNLVACYLTVFYHGGRIWAEHTKDGRNAIKIVLPVVPPREQPTLGVRSLHCQTSKSDFSAKACETILPS